VRRRTSIRTRVSLLYALLAGALIVICMGAVYVIEDRDTHQRLGVDARRAAVGVLAASQQPGDDENGTTAIQRYLAARSSSDSLLVSWLKGKAPVVNKVEAKPLAGVAADASRSFTQRIGGTDYLVAVVANADGSRAAGAALPLERANRELQSLLRRMLQIGAIGLIATLLIAWFAVHRALRPLQWIADGAARVSAGDLDVRLGDHERNDEIAVVAQAIDAMLERLQESFNAQRRFVQDASHELRTPLTIARGHLEVLLLQPNPPPAEVRETVGLAVDELDRMGKVVTSLLRLARLDEEGLSDLKPVPVRALLEDAAARARPLGDRMIAVAIEPGADVDLLGDRDSLDQVLLNLVSNAVRHTRDGGRIVLGAGVRGSEIALVVADDGEGIPPAVLPTLFDRFTRADTARRRDTGGAGLGLAICRSIVEAHGGVIGAASEPGHGATFTVLLPLRRDR
jgi:signal transduction histidine kinase